MSTLTRRRSARDNEPEEKRDERPTRRRSREAEPEDEAPRRARRSRDTDDEDKDDKPRRGRRSDSDEGPSRRGRGTRGFGSYSEKKRSTSSFADEFKPESGKPTLIKFLEDGPFDSYNQHWIQDMPQGERKSYVCLDDDYFGDRDDRDECPLCVIGEPARTFSLFNILNLGNPDKPVNQVWVASPTVADKLERAAGEKKSSPLDREDLYFEVEVTKTKNKTTYDIQVVKARDLQEDFEMEPLDADEIEDFSKKLFDDRKAVTKVDDYDGLQELADSLD